MRLSGFFLVFYCQTPGASCWRCSAAELSPLSEYELCLQVCPIGQACNCFGNNNSTKKPKKGRFIDAFIDSSTYIIIVGKTVPKNDPLLKNDRNS